MCGSSSGIRAMLSSMPGVDLVPHHLPLKQGWSGDRPCSNVCRNALAQAQQAAAQAIASKGKDGSAAGDDKKSPVKQEPGADTKDGVKPPQVLHRPKPAGVPACFTQ